MLYLIPHEYIGKRVDVRITGTIIEVFYNQNRIASHRRLYGRKGRYSTITEHMPKEHQYYLEWNCEWHNKNTHFWRRKFPTLLCLNEYIFYTESVTNNSPP